MQPRHASAYIVVSGPPGSGKSTVARELARILDLPLFAKDTIKEALLDSLGATSVTESQRLGRAALHTLLALAKETGSGVLESTWQASLAAKDLRALPAPIIEVFCAVDPNVARTRYRARASTRHPGHFDDIHGSTADLWTGERAQPIAGGWPVLQVDTSCTVDVEALFLRVSDALRA